jgi:hypothetical protein
VNLRNIKQLHDEENYMMMTFIFCSSPTTVKVINSRTKWVRHVAYTVEITSAYKSLITMEKDHLGDLHIDGKY